MFEERKISIRSYNLETVLAEKLETILSRGALNTRMRNFYDIYILLNLYESKIKKEILKAAFDNTCKRRGFLETMESAALILNHLESNSSLRSLWESYQKKFDYAAELYWKNVVSAVLSLYNVVK